MTKQKQQPFTVASDQRNGDAAESGSDRVRNQTSDSTLVGSTALKNAPYNKDHIPLDDMPQNLPHKPNAHQAKQTRFIPLRMDRVKKNLKVVLDAFFPSSFNYGGETDSSNNSSLSRRDEAYQNNIVVDDSQPDAINVTVVESDFKSLLLGHGEDIPRQGLSVDTRFPSEVTIRDPPSPVTALPSGLEAFERRAAPQEHHSLFFWRWRSRVLVWMVHDPFPDPVAEATYQEEEWFSTKTAALVSCVYLFATWLALTIALAIGVEGAATYNKVAYYSICCLTAVPIILLAAANVPLYHPWTWQICLFFATWTLPVCLVFDAHACDFWAHNTCPGKDFVGFMYYCLAFPTVAIFLLKGQRWIIALGGLVVTLCMLITITPDQPGYAKSVVNFMLFIAAILWASYYKERGDRKNFILRIDLKRQYKATQKAQQAQRVADESKKGFTSYIFHEVRVPLNTALLACQELNSDKTFCRLTSDQEEVTAGLSNSLKATEKVLNDVLDFQRMEAGKLSLTNQPFHFRETMQSAVDSFKDLARQRGVELVVNFDPAIDQCSTTYLGDKARTAQVVQNLLSNAVRFTSQNGKVQCDTILLYPFEGGDATREPIDHPLLDRQKMREDTAIIRIEVTDNGVGVNPQDLEDNRLFSPYVQTELGRRQGGKGSGLGLALVRESIELSEGRLGVKSEPGKGSTFWLEIVLGIPFAMAVKSAVERRPETRPAIRPSIARHSDKTLRVLVVDDDKLTRSIMSKMLSRSGHIVAIADSGLSGCKLAIAQLKAGKPFDAIFIDNQMPAHDDEEAIFGIEAIRRMRRAGVEAFICGFSGDGLAQEAFLEAGADDMLVKPVSMKLLESVLEKARVRV